MRQVYSTYGRTSGPRVADVVRLDDGRYRTIGRRHDIPGYETVVAEGGYRRCCDAAVRYTYARSVREAMQVA